MSSEPTACLSRGLGALASWRLRGSDRALDARLARKAKRLRHRLGPPPIDQKKVMILGCQRSGTTVMRELFENDPDAQTFGESSALSSEDREHRLRLDPPYLVERRLERTRAPLVVFKPLVESQHAPRLLESFRHVAAVWMVRDYKAVSASNRKHFGADCNVANLRPIAEGDPSNWRSEAATPAVRELIHRHYDPGMSPDDAGVLFWIARNSLLFDLRLDQHPRVLLCRYEDFIDDPETTLRRIYEAVNRPYPGPRMTASVHRLSADRGKKMSLDPAIVEQAEAMKARLDAVYHRQRLDEAPRAAAA